MSNPTADQITIPKTLLLHAAGYYFYALLDADDGLIDVVGTATAVQADRCPWMLTSPAT